MNTMVNIVLCGTIEKIKNKLYFNSQSIFNKQLKIELLKDKETHITEEELRIQLNDYFESVSKGTTSIILKNIIETKDGRYLTIINQNSFEILNKDLMLFNLKIKTIKNGKYLTSTILDLYNENIENLDLSFSINKETDFQYIEKIINTFENERSSYSFGIQELNFIKELISKYDYINLSLIDLKNIAKNIGYESLVRVYFKGIEDIDLTKSKLVDDFIYYKSELKNKNFSVLPRIKESIREHGYGNIPIFLNIKVRSAMSDKILLINFIKYEYEKIKLFYQKFNKNVDFDLIEKEVYVNDIIVSSNLKNKQNINNVSIVNNNRLLLGNLSRYGLTSTILEQINELGGAK